jgi:predicted extracellular nuclease
MAQAMGLRKIIDARLAQNPDELIAVAGDFNDVMDSEAVRMILGDAKAVRSQELYNLELWPCELMVEAETRYTMVYRGTRQMLDHIFVSRGLRERFKSAHINHKGMKPAKEGGWSDMRPGSDHAPFTASFSLKDQ